MTAGGWDIAAASCASAMAPGSAQDRSLQQQERAAVVVARATAAPAAAAAAAAA
eukprot:CAMPEP_0195087072 /NCGR_PEP_ID=MMETSP0448-20130528/27021_1 /TAXON_ID=66468 /ORGANISM="Heterocapsa triquestra, Strain CCMP 448" /LENGTH=53 /DNA_ID=CAMNT_0040120605 /DNA_START=174 /DNA_END=332 /DNA_ORIENTATION=+